MVHTKLSWRSANDFKWFESNTCFSSMSPAFLMSIAISVLFLCSTSCKLSDMESVEWAANQLGSDLTRMKKLPLNRLISIVKIQKGSRNCFLVSNPLLKVKYTSSLEQSHRRASKLAKPCFYHHYQFEQ